MSLELMLILGALSLGPAQGDAAGLIVNAAYNPLVIGSYVPAPDLLDDFDEKPATETDPDDWFGMDKFWHFSVSCVLTGASYHLVHNRFGGEDPAAAVIALSGAFAFGVLKEFYDLWRYGLFSCKDLLYDTLGITAAYFIFIHPF